MTDAENWVLGIHYDMEPRVLINENYILISYSYGTWTIKLFLVVQYVKYWITFE